MRAPRKTASKVKLGRVHKKNNWAETPDNDFLGGTVVVFERRRPSKGYRHVLRRADRERFIALLPDWDELAVGLDTVALVDGERDLEGCVMTGGSRLWPGHGSFGRTTTPAQVSFRPSALGFCDSPE